MKAYHTLEHGKLISSLHVPLIMTPTASTKPILATVRADKTEALAIATPPTSYADNRTILPRSVRGAPSELRRLIRKKQNSDSARRCRMRLQQERQRDSDSAAPLPERVHQLTALVSEMQTRLAAAEYSCAALLERALAALQPPFAETYAYPPMPVTTANVQVDLPRAASPAILPLDPMLTLAALPEDSPLDSGCAQPPSPTAVNMQSIFDTPEVPLKQSVGLFDETTDCEQSNQFSSDVLEHALF